MDYGFFIWKIAGQGFAMLAVDAAWRCWFFAYFFFFLPRATRGVEIGGCFALVAGG